MNAYDALLRAAQASRGAPQARPVHHILEEVSTPRGPVVVGSNWRNEALSKLQEFEAIASDMSRPYFERHQYQQAVNHLRRLIADEDAFHATERERMLGAEAESDLARLDAARARARTRAQEQDMRGLSLEEAQRRGWIPPR
jgi:hypothetical protein